MHSGVQFWQSMINEAIRNKAEYNYLDFKAKLSDNNSRLKEHINAFGNSEIGGCFVFGVNRFIPIGIEHPWDDIIQKVANLAKNTQEPPLNVKSFSIQIEGKELLCLHILPGITRPVFIKDRAPFGEEACFKRTGSSTIAMSIQEIKSLLISSTNNYYDESPVDNVKIDSLDFEKLSEFLPSLDKKNQSSSKNISILKDYRILIGPEKDIKITVAGWLCFSLNTQSQRQFRNASIEFQIFKGTNRADPIKKYEISGTLPEQIEKSITLLKQNIWLIPKLHGTKRTDIPAYQEITLREVITNSLVHRDYTKMHQPVKIALFENRIEIENPGGLLPGLTIFNLIHKRDWRNPLLAELMKKFGFGEMDGQGIDRLYSATLKIKVPPPKFINNHNSFAVILSAPKSYEEFSPEEKKLMTIIIAIMHETIDNENVRNGFGISSEKAGTLIKSMIKSNVLESNGRSRKYATYSLTETYREKIFD